MSGRYRSRRFNRYNRSNRRQQARYSVENITNTITATNASAAKTPIDGPAVTLVAASTIQGVRKVKGMKISFQTEELYVPRGNVTVLWAVIYAPEGVTNSTLNEQGSFYEPNQHVLHSGVLELGGQNTYRVPVSKNLTSGDTIILLTKFIMPGKDANNVVCNLRYMFTYAISFN